MTALSENGYHLLAQRCQRGITVLIELPPDAGLSTLTAELAWCLERFVTGRADEPAMRRAEKALEVWKVSLQSDVLHS